MNPKVSKRSFFTSKTSIKSNQILNTYSTTRFLIKMANTKKIKLDIIQDLLDENKDRQSYYEQVSFFLIQIHLRIVKIILVLGNG